MINLLNNFHVTPEEQPQLDSLSDGKLILTRHLLGKGTFGKVYRVDNCTHSYALKRMSTSPFDNPEDEEDCIMGRLVVENVHDLAPLLSQCPLFVKLYAFSNPASLNPYYVSEYIFGLSVADLLEEPVSLSFKVHALFSYASMLTFLHEKGYVFVDNKWDSLLYSHGSFRVIDPDFISQAGKPHVLDRFIYVPCTELYASREQLSQLAHEDEASSFLVQPLHDTESLAMMTDALFNNLNYPTIRRHYFRGVEEHLSYPKERREKLPQPLQEIVGELLAKQRNDSITIKDMMDAIEKL